MTAQAVTGPQPVQSILPTYQHEQVQVVFITRPLERLTLDLPGRVLIVGVEAREREEWC